MTDEEVHAIYHHPKIRALVALPHGEGFGLPIYEAAYSNLPVVATGWSGHLDFLVDEEGKEQFYNVAYDLQPVQDAVVWDGVIMKDSMWAYSRESSAKEQMRQCYEDITNDVKRFENNLLERFNDTKMYETFVNAMNLTFDDEEEIEEWLSNLDAEEYE
jgi:glycosyltransferase involved in cell wall biosynthesis